MNLSKEQKQAQAQILKSINEAFENLDKASITISIVYPDTEDDTQVVSETFIHGDVNQNIASIVAFAIKLTNEPHSN
jgi:hypothetical protein